METSSAIAPMARTASCLSFWTSLVHEAGSVSATPEEPKVTINPDDSIEVLAWIIRVGGMRPGRTLDLKRYQFSAAGEVASETVKTVTENH